MSEQVESIRGVARICRGNKLHPAIQFSEGNIMIVCGCPNTSNGHAAHSATFYKHFQPNCRNRGNYYNQPNA